ncbi:nitrogen fixation protein NifQ [Shewanella dokdonensis]|uniref:Nitrogen fixation protein NifQ n=1 Tax=Shewanella dokdonensis TaxID=712036 RepID=A0ABX8DI96_9GAMM|nr:nitrogen fixation protein NifQ [Shewanella dokdonensis]MCL1074440.1 nitrogen fixation protein NifQ [Shewanella dokdonensis]QVK24110.1 nitrogen fixation protein NifQ [Shewanella dokdonensis]
MTKEDEIELFWLPIMLSYIAGDTVLPPMLGLEHAPYEALTAKTRVLRQTLNKQHQHALRQLRQQLRNMRHKEYQELMALLLEHANPDANLVEPAAAVIACGCLGNRHLWKDLGLPERPRLSRMFAWYFPQLFRANDRNMRWKRFLYKQLCEQGGDYICRAPSCDECSTYSECFGAEEH